MKVIMPPALATYFSAEETADIDVLERCFEPDAVVRDEGQVVRGLDAIKAWKLAARAKYRYRVEPLSVSREGATATVLARLTGSFPGSPVEVTYRFGLAGDKVASLEIR
jgi:SnoaL-like domain